MTFAQSFGSARREKADFAKTQANRAISETGPSPGEVRDLDAYESLGVDNRNLHASKLLFQ